jgi:hypothetical protein
MSETEGSTVCVRLDGLINGQDFNRIFLDAVRARHQP